MLIFILCTILLIVGLLTVQQIHNRHAVNLLSKLPSPPTFPFLGNILILNDSYEGLWKKRRKWLNELYPTICLWLFSSPLVIMRHPDDIQILIKSKSNINKSHYFYDFFRKYGNEGLIMSGGEKWQNRRKMMNQAFLYNTLRATAESANKYSELLIQQMLRWENETIQNTLTFSMNYSLDIVCDSFMGYDLHKIGASFGEKFRKALENVMELVTYRALRPFLKDWMVKLLPLERVIVNNKQVIHAFSKRVIDERRNYHKINGMDLLSDNFINGFKKNTDPEDTDPEANPLKELILVDMLCFYNAKGIIDEEGMIEEIETLIAAGFETTGLAVAYTLLLFAENKNEQDLARQEVTDVMKKSGNKLTIKEVLNLQYLDRCVKESLRLFPSAPMIGRRLVEDTQFSKYVLPRGTDVFISIYDVQRDPKFWTEPEKFNPDRFLPEYSKNRHPYAYLPFSGGLRNCIGQKYAMVEVKVLIAHILKNFYLKPIDYTCDIPLNINVVLTPSTHKLRVKFVKICQDN